MRVWIYIDPANLDGMVDVIFTYKDAYDAFAHERFNTEVTVGDLGSTGS